MTTINENNGWLRLHRSMVDWGWYDEPNTKVVFLHLLLTANWKESEYHGYTIKAGDAVFGTESLARELSLSRQQVRTALNHLKKTGEITIKSTNKFSVATIENWAKYQLKCDGATNNLTNEQPTNNQQVTTLEEIKKERSKEYIDIVLEKWNSICVDFPKVIKATKGTARGKTIEARYKEYGLDTIEKVFSKVQGSPFLKGENNNNWQATFDWVMKPSNFIKVLEGNYDRKDKRDSKGGTSRDWDGVLFG